MAVKILDYKVKKFEHWTAETQRNLPMLIKKALLVVSADENQVEAKLVCNSHY